MAAWFFGRRKRKPKEIELVFRSSEGPLSVKASPQQAEFKLSMKNITEVSPELFCLANLTTLNLGGNKLTTLPPEIGHLTNLTRLSLGGNKLTTLPPEIGRLTNLSMLNLSNNQLSMLPPELFRLTSLTHLYLSDNKLSMLPQEIGHLINLTTLTLGGNKLTTLPPEIGRLTNLSMLNLHCIQVTTLPPEIGRLINLTTLNLSGNQLTTLPPEIGHLINLTTLNLSGNPFADPCLHELASRKNKFGSGANIASEVLAFLRKSAAEEEAHHKPVPVSQKAPTPASGIRATRQSSVADVCRWLESIGLGALVQVFTTNRIDGIALFELTEADLKDMGVVVGDKKKLLSALRDLQAPPSTAPVTASPVVFAASSIPDSRATAAATGGSALPQQRRAKFVAPESESVAYKGLLELPDSYKPEGTCAQELLAARAVLGSKVPQLELIVKEVGSVSWSILAGQTAQDLVKAHGLTEQEVFAIVAYTYDLGLSGAQSENLYFQLNELLRRRVQLEMRAVMGYLYFILSALRKLPAFEGTVFRGNNSPGMVASDYTTGREIFWSGFTSTTTDLAAALDFAGRDGVVFRIKINSGRSIAKLSTVQRENEVLLPPNACLIVFSEMHREADGVQYVDLVEKKDSFRW